MDFIIDLTLLRFFIIMVSLKNMSLPIECSFENIKYSVIVKSE